MAVLLNAFLIEALQRAVADGDIIHDDVGRDPDIGDLAGLGQGKAIWERLVMGCDLFFRRGGHGGVQIGGGQRQIREPTRLLLIGRQRINQCRRRRHAPQNRRLQDGAGDLRTNFFLKFACTQTALAEKKLIGLAVERAICALESGDLQNLVCDLLIPNGERHYRRLIIKGRARKKALTHLCIYAVGNQHR